MAAGSPSAGLVLSFGRFALSPGERLLTKDGVPVEIGARTLDTLIALASRPNEVAGKRTLMAEIWPGVTVEEGSLRFHIAALRKALGDGKGGARYIATLAGRGYCFVAPVTRSGGVASTASVVDASWRRASFLPAQVARMIGREDDVAAISAELTASRFVTIVGPGGVGKTTVAVAVAHNLLQAFDGAALFADFGLLTERRMVPASVASMLGLSVQSEDPLPSLIAFLGERRVLLVLDNCEHVIEAVAPLASRLFLEAPGSHILATSREVLRVGGERVHRLPPLGVPPQDRVLTASDVLNYPATRLFVEQARARGVQLDLAGAQAGLVAHICRKLDGMALAIELAAGRVEAYGLDQIATLLDQRLTLLWPGRRTAPARQKTLQATLGWSYGLLPDTERVVFRHLAVFVGSFTIDAALAVVASESGGAERIFAAIDSLVDKSMIMAFPAGSTMRYRLLGTARTFALHMSVDPGESAALAARHAQYCLRWLEQFAANGSALQDPVLRAAHLADLHNVRAALAWCFGEAGDTGTGIVLAAAAAPVFFGMSLLTECQIWSQRALEALDAPATGGHQEMRLQAALGLSLMWTRGNSDVTHAALSRSFAIASERGDALTQILVLAPLHVFHMRTGDFRTAQQVAHQVAGLAQTNMDPDAIALSRILLGYSHHFAGELQEARRTLEAALAGDDHKTRMSQDGVPQSVRMRDDAMAAPILVLASSAAPSALARTLWLQGHPAAAMQHVRETLRSSAVAGHPVTLLVAVMYAISVMVWNGDFEEAEEQAARFISNAQSYALTSHVILGRCFQGQLAICRGDHEYGLDVLHTNLSHLRALRYELLTTSFSISLVQALTATGRYAEGISCIESALRFAGTSGDSCGLPELLRVKASLLRCLPEPLEDAAEECLDRAVALSRQQGAIAWELRVAIDRAARLAAQEMPGPARELLQPVYQRFAADSETADLRTARHLLAALR